MNDIKQKVLKEIVKEYKIKSFTDMRKVDLVSHYEQIIGKAIDLTIQLKDEEQKKEHTERMKHYDEKLDILLTETREDERQKTAQKILKEVQEYLDEIDATFATFLWSHGYEKQMKRLGEKWNKLKQKFASQEGDKE